MSVLMPPKGVELVPELDLIFKEDLSTYDGLSLVYHGQLPSGQAFILHWADQSDMVDRELVFLIDISIIEKVKNNLITMREAYDVEFCYVLDTDRKTGNIINLWHVLIKDLDESYLPKKGTFLNYE